MAKLGADQIAEKLKALAGWEYKDNAISKMFKFKEFLHGIEFVQKVAEIAEAGDHHPDITINYTRVTFCMLDARRRRGDRQGFQAGGEYRDRIQRSRGVGASGQT